jgi:hypothetical protein
MERLLGLLEVERGVLALVLDAQRAAASRACSKVSATTTAIGWLL